MGWPEVVEVGSEPWKSWDFTERARYLDHLRRMGITDSVLARCWLVEIRGDELYLGLYHEFEGLPHIAGTCGQSEPGREVCREFRFA